MENLVNNIPDINKGRLTAMRWCWAAAMSLLCCINETVLIFVLIAHAVIFIIVLLNRDMTTHISEVKFEYKKQLIEIQNKRYDSELNGKKESWISQFLVYNFNKTQEEAPAIINEVKVSSHVEKAWQESMKESIENGANTIEFDVLPTSPRSFSRKISDIDFELD